MENLYNPQTNGIFWELRFQNFQDQFCRRTRLLISILREILRVKRPDFLFASIISFKYCLFFLLTHKLKLHGLNNNQKGSFFYPLDRIYNLESKVMRYIGWIMFYSKEIKDFDRGKILRRVSVMHFRVRIIREKFLPTFLYGYRICLGSYMTFKTLYIFLLFFHLYKITSECCLHACDVKPKMTYSDRVNSSKCELNSLIGQQFETDLRYEY